jgi:class 3 adenylate cyclase
MPCFVCATVNEAGRKFCKECGSRLAVACTQCGEENSPDDKFCGQCGTALAQPSNRRPSSAEVDSGPASARDSDTERRLVSVLFVDLVGFTTFSEGRDAEEVRAMLTRYFEAASDAVQRHGGRVEKFIGDAVMAVWGTPVAHEDDAERAVRSALEIVDRVEAIGAALGVPLKARGGVLTGEAVAVLSAVDQGLVTGDLVNTASRLQSAAAPGTVLIGERTYRSVSQSIACVPVEPLSLKGKAEPVPAWLALRLVSGMGGSNRGTAPEPPFVGRDEELRLAKELIHATGRERRPRLLHVSGVAGIGKSRLVWEIKKYIDGLTETFLWHQGRCPSYGEGLTFWALAEMVRTRAGIADTDDDATARARLAECLERYVVDDDERQWIEPKLGHLIGLDGLSGGRDELYGAWRRFFERVAEEATVVLVLEDLHWADPGLMDFLESLLEWSRSSPVIVITLARPELSDRRPHWGVGVRTCSTVHLDRLADAEIEEMVSGYVGGLPAQGLARLVSRAEGIPMYAVESVRMLADRGALAQRAEKYEVVGEIGAELEIPETLHALVAARLDGLPDAERALVQDASVAGHSFTVATLCAVTGRDAADLEPLLRTLVRKEVLDQDADPRSPERGQYRFVQSVIHEVAYSTLSKAARRSRHLACARWFESLDDDELASVVASHYLEAYRAEPAAADADEIADHARQWLMRAEERASSLGAPEQAYGYAIEALSLSSTQTDRAALNGRAALSANAVGDTDSAWSHSVAAADGHRALGDVGAEARVLANLWTVDAGAERQAEWVARLVDVDSRLPEDRPLERALVLSALAAAAAHRGHLEAALDYSDRAMIVAETVGSDAALRPAAHARAFALTIAGRHFESRLLMEATVEIARRTGSPLEEARGLMTFGTMVCEDDLRAAMRAWLDSAALSERAGMRPLEGMALSNVSEVAVDLGEWDIAERALADLGMFARDQSLEADGGEMTMAMLTAFRGNPLAALAALDDLEARRGASWDVVLMRTWFLRVRALCLFLAGDSRGASDVAAESMARDPSGANAGSSLWTAIQAECAMHNPSAIRTALDSTVGLRGRWMELARETANAAVVALDREDGASSRMDAALDAWLAAGLPLDHALATLCAMHVLSVEDLGTGHPDRARTYLTELQADAVLRLYEAVQVP